MQDSLIDKQDKFWLGQGNGAGKKCKKNPNDEQDTDEGKWWL